MENKREVLYNVQFQYLDERYQELRQLTDKTEQTTLVWDTENEQVCIRKVLRREQGKIYELMRDNTFEQFPMINDIVYAEDYCVMIREYCNGITLDKLIQKEGPLGERKTVCIIQQILQGLKQIHRLGLVHRDINPGNIIVASDGKIKIIDMGIARQTKLEQYRDTQILGTAGYAAPEQFGFQQTDARADIYSIGVLMRFMLTGIMEYQGKYKGLLGEIIDKCTQMNPQDRYADADELGKALEGCNAKKGRILPGFRTGVLWKKVIAVIGYVLILLSHIIFLTDAYGKGGTTSLGIELSALFFYCWIPLLVMTNFMRWSRRLWPFSKMSRDATIVLRIVIPILSIYLGLELDTLARTI